MKIKLYAIVFIVAATSLTSVAFGAAEEAPVITASEKQPYLIAFHAADTTLPAKEIKMKVINDAFIASSYVPTSTPAIVATNRIGAGVTFSTATGHTMCGITSTGYNSLVEQTDSTPFIAADGTRVFDGMVAANFLKFGTKIKIPAYYGDKVFTVHDRMAVRFSSRVDIWFEHKPDAMKWGKRTICIEILEA
jgi:3D (Asp-Asp-Asp) domain-containing protein